MTAGGRLGILGGTFDPIHVGHTAMGEAARDALGLERVIVMPSRTPPHRPQQPLASAFHRFAMAALAVDGAERFEAGDLELRTPGPSYTADTLDRLHATGLERDRIFFITGADAFAEIETWSRYPDVLDLAHFVVVSRPGYDARSVVQRIPAAEARVADGVSGRAVIGTSIFVVSDATPDVSSTDVRRRLRDHEPVTGLVAAAVERHIRRHRLYSPATPASPPPRAADHLHGQD
jgi:nicotinate-nucleotide adenylyltransferase